MISGWLADKVMNYALEVLTTAIPAIGLWDESEILSFYSSMYFTFQEGLITLAIAWVRIAPTLFFYLFE